VSWTSLQKKSELPVITHIANFKSAQNDVTCYVLRRLCQFDYKSLGFDRKTSASWRWHLPIIDCHRNVTCCCCWCRRRRPNHPLYLALIRRIHRCDWNRSCTIMSRLKAGKSPLDAILRYLLISIRGVHCRFSLHPRLLSKNP